MFMIKLVNRIDYLEPLRFHVVDIPLQVNLIRRQSHPRNLRVIPVPVRALGQGKGAAVKGAMIAKKGGIADALSSFQ